MIRKDLILLLSLICEIFTIGAVHASSDYLEYVDPLIGTGGHGHVFLGASVPHGMVQIGPNNKSIGWEWCSGYNDSDSTIIGFAQTHLSGTGIADLGDVILMPSTTDEWPIVSTFDKKNQHVSPGYYSVLLNKNNIVADMTATTRTSLQRYTYPSGSKKYIVVDLLNGVKSLMSRKGWLESNIKVLNDSTIQGYRKSNEWATDHRIYFTTVFSEKILGVKYAEDGKVAILQFVPYGNELQAKTGISYVSCEGAAKNLQSEQSGFEFGRIKEDAQKAWNKELSKIDFNSSDGNVMKIFYTALYHTSIQPSIFSDVDGFYRGADGKTHQAKDFVPYTIFSLWDTYRATQPLYTLIDNREKDYVNSLLTIYEQQGELPMWHLAGNETHCMVGLHSIPVIVDACLKGIEGVDSERAYNAVSSIRNSKWEGLDYLNTKGYVPADKVEWAVAKGLEYAIDYYSVAQLAKKIGHKSDYNYFSKGAKSYKYYFDPRVDFMRGRMYDGSFRKEFDPSHSVHMMDDYVEGNAWQYTWLVPHDIDGLVKLFGGKDKLISKLDDLFTVSSELNEGASADITGMIGQYAHGNEPSHHIIYIYSYLGENGKCSKRLEQVYDEFYKTEPDGLIGNEDCGQMSAWYVFSALGFYPLNPVSGEFVCGRPLVKNATIKLVNGKNLRITTRKTNNGNIIKKVLVNGSERRNLRISYSEIMRGGIIEFVLD